MNFKKLTIAAAIVAMTSLSAVAPVFAVAAMPVKARPTIPILSGWEVDAGARYWYSSGTEKNTSGTGSLVSQLTYSNLTGQSGEFFASLAPFFSRRRYGGRLSLTP